MSPLKKKKLNLIRKKLDKLDNTLINIIKKRTLLVKEVIKLKELLDYIPKSYHDWERSSMQKMFHRNCKYTSPYSS